jgi:uncharacterized protein YjbJ (UPF0337 family)
MACGYCVETTKPTRETAMDGTTDDMKGRAKEAVGDLTDDSSLKAEGKGDRAAGKAKDVIDDVKDKAEDMVDKVKDKIKKD